MSLFLKTSSSVTRKDFQKLYVSNISCRTFLIGVPNFAFWIFSLTRVSLIICSLVDSNSFLGSLYPKAIKESNNSVAGGLSTFRA